MAELLVLPGGKVTKAAMESAGYQALSQINVGDSSTREQAIRDAQHVTLITDAKYFDQEYQRLKDTMMLMGHALQKSSLAVNTPGMDPFALRAGLGIISVLTPSFRMVLSAFDDMRALYNAARALGPEAEQDIVPATNRWYGAPPLNESEFVRLAHSDDKPAATPAKSSPPDTPAQEPTGPEKSPEKSRHEDKPRDSSKRPKPS